jgi:hypothetical protein
MIYILHQDWTVVLRGGGLDGLFRINQEPENFTIRIVIKKQLNGYQLFVLIRHISYISQDNITLLKIDSATVP